MMPLSAWVTDGGRKRIPPWSEFRRRPPLRIEPMSLVLEVLYAGLFKGFILTEGHWWNRGRQTPFWKDHYGF